MLNKSEVYLWAIMELLLIIAKNMCQDKRPEISTIERMVVEQIKNAH